MHQQFIDCFSSIALDFGKKTLIKKQDDKKKFCNKEKTRKNCVVLCIQKKSYIKNTPNHPYPATMEKIYFFQIKNNKNEKHFFFFSKKVGLEISWYAKTHWYWFKFLRELLCQKLFRINK